MLKCLDKRVHIKWTIDLLNFIIGIFNIHFLDYYGSVLLESKVTSELIKDLKSKIDIEIKVLDQFYYLSGMIELLLNNSELFS